MNMEKEYTKAENKNCNICGKKIDIEDVRNDKIIMAILKNKRCAMVHKTCLVWRDKI